MFVLLFIFFDHYYHHPRVTQYFINRYADVRPKSHYSHICVHQKSNNLQYIVKIVIKKVMVHFVPESQSTF